MRKRGTNKKERNENKRKKGQGNERTRGTRE
jgi:hypothetical protein